MHCAPSRNHVPSCNARDRQQASCARHAHWPSRRRRLYAFRRITMYVYQLLYAGSYAARIGLRSPSFTHSTPPEQPRSGGDDQSGAPQICINHAAGKIVLRERCSLFYAVNTVSTRCFSNIPYLLL
jgi:hypothetical protein